MVRPAVWVASVAAVLAAAGPARATPPGPPPPAPPCQFTLSATQADQVVATVQSIGCAALAAPYSAVACLQPADGALTCAQAHGGEPARVVLPYRPGVVYTATGRGCAGWVSLPPAPDCQSLGPNSATQSLPVG